MLRDLGLTYEEAAHGVQSSIAKDMTDGRKATEPKHMRTGIDMSKADMLGLVTLLIEKGVFTSDEYIEFTSDEYIEAVRLSANEELAMREEEAGGIIKFR